MIVVKVELHSAITGGVKNLATVLIANDGTGTQTRGNYNVRVLRGGPKLDPRIKAYHYWTHPRSRTGRVEDYPRKSYHVLRLVLRALAAAFPEERKASK